jgi:hypothetical protein
MNSATCVRCHQRDAILDCRICVVCECDEYEAALSGVDLDEMTRWENSGAWGLIILVLIIGLAPLFLALVILL